MKTIPFLATAAMLLVTNSVMASTIVVASDNFEQVSTANTSIVGVSGGTGWLSPWQSAQVTANQPQVVDPAVDLQGIRSLQFSTDSDRAAFRILNTTVGGDVLISFLFQYSAPQGAVLGNNDFLGLWFGNENGPNIGLKANCGGTPAGCINDAFVRTENSNTSMIPGSDLHADTTYQLFGHLYKTAGSSVYNKFDAWLNPTASEMSTLLTPDVSSTGLSTIGSFNTIGFRSVNLDSGITVRVDDIQVSVVPEPASIALFGLALLGMAGIRRGRRS